MKRSWKWSWPKLLQFRGLGSLPDRAAKRPRAARLLVEALEDRTVPSVLTVTNTHDTSVAGDGSLRGEILAAQSGDTVQFSSTLKGKTITLTSHSEILISNSITVKGLGSGALSISGSHSRLFEIAVGANVTISGLTLKSGSVTGSFPTNPAEGGAILDRGTLTLANDVIKGNSAIGSPGAAGEAGGVFADVGATLTLNGDTLKGNTAEGVAATGEGGGLYLASGSQDTLTNVMVQSNTAIGAGAVSAQGGGLFATGANLTINVSTISANLATGSAASFGSGGGTAQGGGLFLQGGTVSITQTTITGNNAVGGKGGTAGNGVPTGSTGGTGGAGQGGGLFVATAGTISLSADTFFKNAATGGNGGLAGLGPQGGTGGTGGVGQGGAVAVGGGTVNFTNDTFAANVATGGVGGTGGTGAAGHAGAGGTGGNAQGGGIWAGGGAVTLLNDTIAGSSASVASKPTAGNSATGGGGGSAATGTGAAGIPGNGQGGGLFDSGGTFITLKNTIVANNAATTSDPDVSGTFTAQDHNLIGNATGSASFGGSDLTGVDPHLTALGKYGGTTQTMLPLGAPAVDGGDDAVAPATDQRGITRPQGSHSDIGAVEIDNLSFVIASGNPQSARRGTPFKSLVVKVMENGKPVAGVIVDFAIVPAGNGAAGKLNHTQTTTSSKGLASATVTANSKPGSYTVTASLGGLPVLTFNLKNT
jgi:hypothetical protein